ncbi:MnhB domain-containing protein [Natranaerovirga hydrolytica]|uniref:MnhB domain-containing protein n=1 Tax=Natranaerovirga hydrolytica TaxID=680378 RepID=UPI0014034966|nr:MnhB domain-containing protein [Natranaerovirga hydrolytica]
MEEIKNDLTKYLIDIINPFIIVFGFYVILYGDISPGGGFQGGAILASVFILQYLSKPLNEIGIGKMQIIEKFFYLLIVLVPILSIFTRNIMFTNFVDPTTSLYSRFYLIIMNLLIGMKVSLGLTVIFYEFVMHERRWSK